VTVRVSNAELTCNGRVDDDPLELPTVNWSQKYEGADEGRVIKRDDRRDYGRTLTHNVEDDDVLGLPMVDWSRPG